MLSDIERHFTCPFSTIDFHLDFMHMYVLVYLYYIYIYILPTVRDTCSAVICVKMMARIQTINNPWIIITLILCMPCTWIYAKIHADIDFEVEGNGFHRL